MPPARRPGCGAASNRCRTGPRTCVVERPNAPECVDSTRPPARRATRCRGGTNPGVADRRNFGGGRVDSRHPRSRCIAPQAGADRDTRRTGSVRRTAGAWSETLRRPGTGRARQALTDFGSGAMQVYLGLGSNLGKSARSPGASHRGPRRAWSVTIVRVSPVVESPALLPDSAPSEWNRPYLNLVLECVARCSPEQLRLWIDGIQRAFGRQDAVALVAPVPSTSTSCYGAASAS